MSAVRFEHVSKAYDLHSGARTLFSAVKMVTGTGHSRDLFYALSDVSFEISQGEAFGIIGRNGAGKSTILKLIAGITRPTSGRVHISGRISSLIELGAGFHPDLTGRENIYMSGAILGLSRKFIEGKLKEIVDFAELWDFIDVPVKKYSSGMYARLGFSVAVSVDPEILIVDEILSVGDVFFQQKCFARMREIVAQGTTFIYVTHDTAAMQNLCGRALLLDAGKVDFIGSTIEAVSRYYASVGQRLDRQTVAPRRQAQIEPVKTTLCSSRDEIVLHSILKADRCRHGPRGLELKAARITDQSGLDTLQTPMLGSLLFTLLIAANEDVTSPSVGINIYDRMGNLVFAAGTPQLHYMLPQLASGQELIVQFDLGLTVSPGAYTFSLVAAEPVGEDQPDAGFFHDQVEMLGPITVFGDPGSVHPFYGIAQLPLTIRHRLVGD